MRTLGARVGAAVLAAVALAGCSSGPGSSPTSSPEGSDAPAVTGTITVLAASSLTGTFTELARRFEAAHPGTTVRLSFGASSTLATQVVNGIDADVLATASTTTMATVTDAGLAGDPQVFAVNRLAIATPPQADDVTGLADLVEPGVTVAICQPQVPCGAATTTLFDQAGLAVTPATEEADVKAVLTKVELGEVDAGVVYVTDVKAAGSRVRGVAIPDADNVTTSYPIATLDAAPSPAGAAAFVALVLSPEGRAVLAEAGFGSP